MKNKFVKCEIQLQQSRNSHSDDDDDDDDDDVFVEWLTAKGTSPYFELGALSDILTITNL